MCQTLNSPLQRVILRPRFKANARTIKSTPRPWATKPKKTKAPARKSRPTRQLAMLTSNSQNNRDRKRGPWASFCLPTSALFWLGKAAALGKVRPLWRTGFSLPAAVFRLGGLWWPKSLRSKATHTPAILMPQGLLCPAAALPSLGSEKILCSQHELSVYLTSSLIFLKDLEKISTHTHSINLQSRLLEALLVLDPASLARLSVYLGLQGTHQKSHSIV